MALFTGKVGDAVGKFVKELNQAGVKAKGAIAKMTVAGNPEAVAEWAENEAAILSEVGKVAAKAGKKTYEYVKENPEILEAIADALGVDLPDGLFGKTSSLPVGTYDPFTGKVGVSKTVLLIGGAIVVVVGGVIVAVASGGKPRGR